MLSCYLVTPLINKAKDNSQMNGVYCISTIINLINTNNESIHHIEQLNNV